MRLKTFTVSILIILLLTACREGSPPKTAPEQDSKLRIQAVNESEIKSGAGLIAVVGANVIDGKGGPVLSSATVLIQNDRILEVGRHDEIQVPKEALVFEAEGKYLVPGLIDAHFHLDQLEGLPHIFLKRGITSLRDPGAWIEAYDNERKTNDALPRLFLTGPHFDMFPPAYPKNSLIISDEEEAKMQVRKMAEKGASAIKIYYRLSLGSIRAVCEEAQRLGLPVTAHLEISDALEVIRRGVDGIEHVTSFGLSLVEQPEAEAYRQRVLADNNARREGRYEMWQHIDPKGPKAMAAYQLMADRKTFFSPTLAAFEARDDAHTPVRVAGFEKMLEFTGEAYRQGVQIVVGSHSYVPYSEYGWAYHQEMELLQESGMSPEDILQSATYQNARFFKVDDRLGSIETGKIADLLLVESNPYEDIRNMRQINRVMLNGRWIE
ncbi:amidohydrolase family protein [Negadavirga shengliensis]|uniref:Amidohydrolase family protein n=1 Tax=Negadavirga shengliensis TaxID=1389218 RepID=A0ABV9SVC3_9BACT